jgi:hypothetical protein
VDAIFFTHNFDHPFPPTISIIIMTMKFILAVAAIVVATSIQPLVLADLSSAVRGGRSRNGVVGSVRNNVVVKRLLLLLSLCSVIIVAVVYRE